MDPTGKPSATCFRILEQLTLTTLEAIPVTGRTHQHACIVSMRDTRLSGTPNTASTPEVLRVRQGKRQPRNISACMLPNFDLSRRGPTHCFRRSAHLGIRVSQRRFPDSEKSWVKLSLIGAFSAKEPVPILALTDPVSRPIISRL